MSTKTTFKRIALVAVAALGLGLMSVTNAPAAQNPSLVHLDGTARGTCNAPNYVCVNVADEVSWVTVTGTAHYGVQSTFMATVAADTSTYAWSVTSYPAGLAGWAVPVITSTAWKTSTVDGYSPAPGANGTPAAIGGAYDTGASWSFAGTNNADAAVAAAVTNGTVTVTGMSMTTTATAAGGTIGQFYSAVTPTVAGTYVYTLKNALGGQVNTWTVKAYATDAARDAAKVADNLALNTVVASTSTSFLNAGETTTVTAAADTVVSAPSTASATAQAATVVVTSKTAGSIDKTSVTALTVTISGPGSLGIGTAANVASLVSTGRALTGAAGENTIAIFGDGTAGVATVTISAGTTVLATEKVTFYGAVASYTATVAKNVIPMGATTTGVIAVVAKDKDGNVVPGQTVSIKASDATVVADYTATTSTAAEATAGTATVQVIGISAKFGKLTLTISNAAGTISTTAVVTLSSTTAAAAGVKLAFDKAEYTAGEKITLKVTAVDANGLPVAPMDPISGTPTANTSLVGFPASWDSTTTDGSVSYTFYAPLVPGPIVFTGTDSNAAAITASATVISDGVAQAAADAAAEATDAANAATDAANAAAEAADAATAAAQDAADAVAALSTSVAAMIDALKKQITALTNLVIKIQKKVKA